MPYWLPEALQHFLTALATGILLLVLLRQSRRAPVREAASGYVVLRQPPLYRALGWVSASIGLVMLVGSLLGFTLTKLPYDSHEQLGFGISVLAGLMFLGLSAPMLRASATIIILTPLGVAADGPGKRHTFLPWPAITSVRYNAFTHELKIATPAASIKAGRYLVGFDLLLAELTRRLGVTPAQMGLPPQE